MDLTFDAERVDMRYPVEQMPCKKCGGPQKELFIKGKKGLWCPVCNDTGLKKALGEFEDLVAAARP